MNITFILYTLLLVLCIALVVASVRYTFFKKILKLRDWLLIFSGMITLTITVFACQVGSEVNSKMSVEFKVPKDFISNVEYVTDSVIDDATLYNHLLLMKVSFPKVILCQAKIESSQYSSDLFKRNNNLFGMKKSANRVTTASDDNGRAGYKWYPSWRESVTDYALWQLSHHVDKMSQDQYIAYLGKIYAEDPKYTTKIKAMIKQIDFKKLEENEN